MTSELISVIVPVYNVEPYLRRCVDSILHQTYENLEILLIDDGSTDQSGAICDMYAEEDQRVTVVHQPNGGLSAARNRGIDLARGAYLSFVDSDDLIDARMVELLYRDAVEQDAAMSVVGFQRFSNVSEIRIPAETGAVSEMSGKQAIDSLLLSEEIGNFAWNKLYRTELFEGIRYPQGYLLEDVGTTYRLMEKCPVISYRQAPLYFYYQRADSILNRKKTLRFFRDKFDMAYTRYNWLRERFGDFVENDAALLSNIEHCYPYLRTDPERGEAMERFLKQVSPAAAKLLCSSSQRKFWLMKFSRSLYAAMFMLKNGRAEE